MNCGLPDWGASAQQQQGHAKYRERVLGGGTDYLLLQLLERSAGEDSRLQICGEPVRIGCLEIKIVKNHG